MSNYEEVDEKKGGFARVGMSSGKLTDLAAAELYPGVSISKS